MIVALGQRYMTRGGKITGPMKRSKEVQRPYTCGFRNYTFDGKWNVTIATEHDLVLQVPQTKNTHE